MNCWVYVTKLHATQLQLWLNVKFSRVVKLCELFPRGNLHLLAVI